MTRCPIPEYVRPLPESVYPPSEDTFLFMDALEKERNHIQTLNPLFACEIGCGSGLIVSFFAKHIAPQSCFCFATDINDECLLTTKSTSKINKVCVDTICCDLLTPFLPRLYRSIDVILFNPPYVPTDEVELMNSQPFLGGTEGIASSWAGGRDGMEVTNRVLNDLDMYLSENGVAYVILLQANKPKTITQKLKARGFKLTVVLKRSSQLELLYLVKIVRLKPPHP
ncbi:putative eRF1 methyltransferase catalytic subunit mtq2 [Blattamonas nauphoetae]|uniref:ERF1 methyltransferase catalytic subunit mtq2 n=1 Tax=Blattamonas nauphoetae TaxID=2049346 RepID=A0ABQ9YF33_9EUKA|nr:putative eRF1 methyltransferase catalytic subunit mtq2 [Blattamonas nauphoetae]